MGSLSDPKDTPGLAHFCEHMLFYASAKYPEEDAYSKFVVSPTSCIPLSAWPAVLYHAMHANCTKNHAVHGNRMSPAVLELLSLIIWWMMCVRLYKILIPCQAGLVAATHMHLVPLKTSPMHESAV